MAMTIRYPISPLNPDPIEGLAFSGQPMRSRSVETGELGLLAGQALLDCAAGDFRCLSRVEMVIATLIAECLRPRRFDLF